ncbi:MAG TPA: ABC transporter substrate-binding protein, partial [Anaerolineaceae bacterium]|nr:ABC transporter substrate-binding protein [Anaerolineaceae bacterium]
MKKPSLLALLVLALLLAACQPATPTVPAGQTPPAPATAVLATPTATEVPPRVLTICLGQEPQTLYRYGGSARAMWSVLEAIYDGPMDTRGYRPQPVILTGLPDLANGGAQYQPVSVQAGIPIVDAAGELALLQAGSRVLPAGCASADCAVTWDGQSELQMDQLVLRYQLLPDLKWSDGAPLTAADSLYAFQLSADPATPVGKQAVDLTAEYRAVDDQTVEWLGRPGYRTAGYTNFFWSPLPEHAWGSLPAAELLTADVSTRQPLGWGPYAIEEWVQGDHLTLRKNPNYHRAAEGLPYFDTLVYRFLGEQSDSNLNALLSGECDLVDQTARLEDQIPRVQELVGRGLIQMIAGLGPEWEHADFGIRLAAYDAGYSMFGDYRPDIFGDVRVRQAFATCMDRAGLVAQLFSGLGRVSTGFVMPEHPDYAPDLPAYSYDPQAGGALLEQAGWLDHDGDPATPRQAAGVVNVPNGTPLAVEYLTTDAAQRQASAQYLAQSMAACGIQATPHIVTSGELYAAGPEGPLFGRSFDLAQFTWQSSSGSACFLYTGEQIPTADNNWLR